MSGTERPPTPKRLERFVLALAVVSGLLCALAYGLAVQPGAGWTPWLVGLLALLTAGYFFLQRRGFVMHWRGQRLISTIDEPMVYLALVMLPFPAALGVVFAGTAFVQVVARRPPVKALFNIASYTTAAAVGSVLYFALTRSPLVPSFAAGVAGVVAYTVVSDVLVANVFAILEGEPLLRVFRNRYGVRSVVHGAIGGSFGFAAAVLWVWHPLAIVALAPLTFLALGFSKLTAASEREILVRRRLAEMTTDLVAAPEESAVADEVLHACGDLFLAGSATLTLFPDSPSERARSWSREFDGTTGRGARVVEVPVRGRDGRAVGKLSLQHSPRAKDLLGNADQPILEIVAARAGAALEAARNVREILALKNLHEEVVANVPAALARVDAEGRLLQCNAALSASFGADAAPEPGASLLQWPPLQAHPELLEALHGMLTGQPFEEREVVLPDGRTLSAAGVPLGVAGLEGGVVLVSDVTARKRAEEAHRSEMLTRPFVRHLVTSIVAHLKVTPASIADVGRRLARGVEQGGPEDYAAAFRTMGLGNLRFDGTEGGTYVFSADDLLERRSKSTQPTCHLALGFLEGSVASLHEGHALGTELKCQSQGHARCVFVVQPRSAVVLALPRKKDARPVRP